MTVKRKQTREIKGRPGGVDGPTQKNAIPRMSAIGATTHEPRFSSRTCHGNDMSCTSCSQCTTKIGSGRRTQATLRKQPASPVPCPLVCVRGARTTTQNSQMTPNIGMGLLAYIDVGMERHAASTAGKRNDARIVFCQKVSLPDRAA